MIGRGVVGPRGPEVRRLIPRGTRIRTIGSAKMEQRFETPVRPFGTFPSAKESDAFGKRDQWFEASLLQQRVGTALFLLALFLLDRV